MMWQMWTAFGIMCGYIFGVVLAGVGKRLDPGLCVNANHVINVYKNDSIPLGTIDVPTQSLNLAGYVSYDDIVQRKTAGDLLLKENAQSALLSSPCSLNWRMMLASPVGTVQAYVLRQLILADGSTSICRGLRLHVARVPPCASTKGSQDR